jgi:hypothetical protein
MVVSETVGAASRPALAGRPGVAVAALAACAGLYACGGAAGAPQYPKAITTPASTSIAAKGQARQACHTSPAKVIKTYLPGARRRGADKALLRMAADPPKRVIDGPGYALLAGAVYANSLPAARRAGVAPACAKELMSKKSMSNEGTSR